MLRLLRQNRNWLLVLALILAMAPAVGIPLASILTPPPLEYTNLPFPVETPVVALGDAPTIVITRCNHEWRPLIYTTNRRLRNMATNITYALDTSVNVFQPGCSTDRSRNVFIPLEMKSGTYRVEGISEAHGAWRAVYVWLESEPFDVIDNDDE